MPAAPPNHWNYPAALPVVAERERILRAIREHPVVVVVSETGSGKTTQLPKMVAEALGSGRSGAGRCGLVGCTQPRRIAAASVAERVAEELTVPLGGMVGYQVRFEDRSSADTRIKFMTDGILLAETQGDPDLRRYDALILDEAHERSLNIDFLLGYLKRLVERRPELRVVISSATLDAGGFAQFFATGDEPAPVVVAEGRTFPVEEVFLPGDEDEETADGVLRAVDWLTASGEDGDVLVFLPGEREIRDCADALEGRHYRQTEVLPLFARLGMADQQRVFHPGPKRRIVLATNVAETSLTIPRIVCVVDAGTARVSRWSPGRGVQRLQIEEVSQASARQRKGRCGRVRPGVCVRLYDEENLAARPEFTDPEIRRSSLAGVILRMKSLGLPAIEDFPFLDPPAPKAVSEGYRTLREVGALDRDHELTRAGRTMAKLPVDPRLARMLLEGQRTFCLGRVIPIVAGLETQDPRERPAEKAKEADRAREKWRNEDSDFLSMLHLWDALQDLRKGRRWHVNRLRKFCREHFLNFRRVIEWANVAEELRELCERVLEKECAEGPEPAGGKRRRTGFDAEYAALHRALLAGVPRQFGLWDRDERVYRGANGTNFAIFPGSGLFGGKRADWVMAMELVDTTRLWARRVAAIDPGWVEEVAPHLCRSRFGEGRWDEAQGAVYAKETVLCGGLPVVAGRRVHYGRVNPRAAREIFIREGLAQGGVKGRSRIVARLAELREEIGLIEHKLRRGGGLWSDEAVIEFYESRLPEGMCTAKAYHRWRQEHEEHNLPEPQDVVFEDLEGLDVSGFPDWLAHTGREYAVYYRYAPGERDDGVTLGVHIDQLPELPAWLPGWGVPGQLEWRAEVLIRSLGKDLRRACQPVGERARGFAAEWRDRDKLGSIEQSLARFLREATGLAVEPGDLDAGRLPEELVTKVWVCDDAGEELGFGTSVAELQARLGRVVEERVGEAAADEWACEGLLEWPEDGVPERVEAGSGVAYPALVDEGDSVARRVFTDAEEAAERQRGGAARLLMLAQPDQVKYLRKRFPLGLLSKVELPRYGVDAESLLMLAAEGALSAATRRLGLRGGRIREAEEFARAAEAARPEWWGAAEAIASALERALEEVQPVKEWIVGHRADRHHAEIASDLEEELMFLLRRCFAWRAGFPRLGEYPRHVAAMRSRLERLRGMPLARDLEKMARVREFWQPWFREWTRRPEDPGLSAYGWALEELRISLLAPDLPVRGKVSEKALRRELAGRIGAW